MCSNAIYILISCCSRNCWFSMKKCWCQQNLSDVPRDLYIFWIFFGWSITVPSVFIVGYVRPILERVPFWSMGSHDKQVPVPIVLKLSKAYQTKLCLTINLGLYYIKIVKMYSNKVLNIGLIMQWNSMTCCFKNSVHNK